MKKIYITFFIFLISFLSTFSFNSDALYFPVNCNYIITSEYGYRTLGTYHFHSGTDLGLVVGTNLYALSTGTVSFVGYYGSCGHSVIIEYDNGYKSLYGHISPNYLVKVGDRVSFSTVVANVGPKYLDNGTLNGMTTGPHLHFTLYNSSERIDPMSISYKKR